MAKKKIAEVVLDVPQAEEYVVGRFYELKRDDETLFGELLEEWREDAAGLRTLEVWKNGKPERQLDLFFENYPTREISRELCYDLSTVIE